MTVIAFYDADRNKISEVEVPEGTTYVAWAPEGTLRLITYGEVASSPTREAQNGD